MVLNGSHHFFFFLNQNFIRQLEHNDSILIILLCWKILRIYSKVIKFESFVQVAWLHFDFLNRIWWLLIKTKKKFPEDKSLRPGWIVPLYVIAYVLWLFMVILSIDSQKSFQYFLCVHTVQNINDHLSRCLSRYECSLLKVHYFWHLDA